MRGWIYCVEFHTKYLTHALKDIILYKGDVLDRLGDIKT